MLNKRQNEILWSQKYRPSKISELILPDRFKKQLQEMVNSGRVQSSLFLGSAGTGKTSAALALADELDLETCLINASENGNIDTIRTAIRSFASTVSLNGNRKMVLLDEGDYLTPAAQGALRGVIEEFSTNVSFIITGNFSNKIIGPLKSRLAQINFEFTKEERIAMIKEFDARVKFILTENSITFDPKTLAMLIVTYFPDFRKIINEVQRACVSGELQAQATRSSNLDSLIVLLKNQDFNGMRNWVSENPDTDFSVIVQDIYTKCTTTISPKSIPQLVLTLNKYDFQNGFCTFREINIVAMLTEIMSDCEFK